MNPFFAQVNQKKLFCYLLLQQSFNAESKHIQQALLQSAVFQLWLALQHYLAEIAASYHCRNPESASAVDRLLNLLESSGKSAAEASELHALSVDKGSWFYQLSHCYRSLVAVSAPKAAPRPDNLISAVVVTDQEYWSKKLDTALVESWLAAFSEMVERHRSTMVEC